VCLKQAADAGYEEKIRRLAEIACKDDRTVRLVGRHAVDHTNVPRGSADGVSGRPINKWESVA